MARRGLIALVASVLVLAGPAWAGEEAPSWPRLPDGRVVIDIYGRRLAFPPDMPPGQVVFQHGNRDVPLRDVIADRAGMERWWSGSGPTMPVGIALSMNLVRPLLFDGPAPLDRRALWLGPAFWVWVYQDPARSECTRQQFEIDRRACAFFLERARRGGDQCRRLHRRAAGDAAGNEQRLSPLS